MRHLLNIGRLLQRPQRLQWPTRSYSDVPSADQLEASTIHPDFLSEKIMQQLQPIRNFNPDPYIDMQKMFDAGVWHGHKIGTLRENMKWALYGERLGTCIFDLEITQKYMRRALQFLAAAAYKGSIVLFVSTNRDTMHLVERKAREVGEYAHTRRWEPSTLTNIKQLFDVPLRVPDVVILLTTLSSTMTPHPAIIEAAKMAIPTIGILDSNCEPNYITYGIPGNDDSVRAVEFYMDAFCSAIEFGKEARKHDNQSE